MFIGERNNIKEKIKEINDYNELLAQDKIKQAKSCNILYLCEECGLIISFREKQKESDFYYMSFDFNNYKDLFNENQDYKPFISNYKINKSTYWGSPTNKICLDCCSSVFEEKFCEECGSDKI